MQALNQRLKDGFYEEAKLIFFLHRSTIYLGSYSHKSFPLLGEKKEKDNKISLLEFLQLIWPRSLCPEYLVLSPKYDIDG